jgi:AcrR family transcriptional regulator
VSTRPAAEPPAAPRRRDAGRPRGAAVTAAVLAAVRAELAAAGPDGLSVERVARRAGVNKTSVYRRWPTREALVAAAMEGLLDEFADTPDTGSLRGDLLALATPVAELAARPDGIALLRAALSAAAADDVGAVAARRVTERAAPVSAIRERAVARAEWRAGVDPRQVVFTLVGAIVHRTLLERADPTGEWLERLVDLVHGGVAVRA